MDKDLLKTVYDKVKADIKTDTLVLINSVDDFEELSLYDLNISAEKVTYECLAEPSDIHDYHLVPLNMIPSHKKKTISVGSRYNITASTSISLDKSEEISSFKPFQRPAIIILKRGKGFYPYLPIYYIGFNNFNSGGMEDIPTASFTFAVDDTPIYKDDEWVTLNVAA